MLPGRQASVSVAWPTSCQAPAKVALPTGCCGTSGAPSLRHENMTAENRSQIPKTSLQHSTVVGFCQLSLPPPPSISLSLKKRADFRPSAEDSHPYNLHEQHRLTPSWTGKLSKALSARVRRKLSFHGNLVVVWLLCCRLRVVAGARRMNTVLNPAQFWPQNKQGYKL